MLKFMDKVVKYSAWFILALSMSLYFAFQVLSFEGEIIKTLEDWTTYVNLILVVILNVQMVSAAYDSAMFNGVETEEFKMAEEINNVLIKKFNNNKKTFRKYVKEINKQELESMQEDFLYKIGDKKLEELTRKELKDYKKIKSITHNVYGFNLPLMFEMGRGHNVNYQASIDQEKGKFLRQIKKVFTGILFGAMTVEMAFRLDNLGAAFTGLIIVSSGLGMTFIMTYMPNFLKLKKTVPKKVLQKKTLFDGFEQRIDEFKVENTDVTDKPPFL